MTQHTNAFPDLDRVLRFIPLGVEEPRVLAPAQVRRYNEVGHLFPIDIFSPTEIAEIRAYIDDLSAKALAAGWNSYEVVNRDSTTAENSVLVQTVDDPGTYGDPPVALEMRAGQISLHSDWILHGSEPNQSDRRRCGPAMRYLSADVRGYLDCNTNSIWCRGTDPTGHWANHSRPPGETIPTAVNRYQHPHHPRPLNSDPPR